MVNDQEGEALVVNNRDELIAATKHILMQHGVPEELADVFCCMRFHPMHPWGIAEAIIDGKHKWCITQGITETQQSRVIATFQFADTIIEPIPDARGVMPAVFFMPEKRELN